MVIVREKSFVKEVKQIL